MVRFEEFKVGDLFDVKTTKSTDKNKIQLIPDGPYDFVGRGVTNWGIQGHLDKLTYDPNPSNVFSLIQIGQTQVFWREKPWYASQNIFMLKPKHESIKDTYLFLQTSLNKALMKYQTSYTSYPTLNTLEQLKIQLPVDLAGQPDWKYMEKRVAELEELRVAELETYLEETGLSDYILTEQEEEILTTEPVMAEFKVGDLFKTQNGDTDLKKSHLNGEGHAVITSGVNNMGIAGYSDKKARIISKNTITVDMFGYAVFRPFDYKMVTHARVFSLEPKGFKLNELTGLYMVSLFKYLPTVFNYSHMCSYNKIKNTTIKLPIQQVLDPDKTYHPEGYIPDWDYMEKYIKAIEKITIKDVVLLKDEIIETAKNIIGKR